MKQTTEKQDFLENEYSRYLEEFLQFLSLSNRSEHTIINYSSDLKKFLFWYQYIYKGRKLSKIDRKIIDKYMLFLSTGSTKISNETSWLPPYIRKFLLLDVSDFREINGEKLSLGSQKRHLSTIKNFFEFLRETYGENGKIFVINPVKNKLHNIRLKEIDINHTKLLTKSDWKKINQNLLSATELLILNLLYSAGLRLSELTNLKLEDFNHSRHFLIIERKGGKIHKFVPNRHKTIFKFLKLHLARLNITQGPIFLGPGGNVISSRTMYNRIMKIMAKSGLDRSLTPHSFRKACATQLYAKHKDLLLVRDYLNHSDAAVTQTYIENLSVI